MVKSVVMNNSLVLAKAVYDNEAESNDELSFRRGDIVTVLEQNTKGLEGWWLCALHDKQGIAPGNRLRILPNVQDPNFDANNSKAKEGTYDVPPSLAWMKPSKMVNSENDEYDIPRQQLTHYDAVDGVDPFDVYDVPKAAAWQQASGEEVYDVPTASMNRSTDNLLDVQNALNTLSAAPDPRELYDVPPIVSRDLQQPNEVYDVPTLRVEPITLLNEMINVQNPEEVYDVPPIKNNSSKISNRHESVETDIVYDIPQSHKMMGGTTISSGLNSIRRMKKEIRESRKMHNQMLDAQTKSDSLEYVYDVPPQVSKDRGISSLSQSNDDVVDGLLKRLSVSDTSSASDLKNPIVSAISRDSITSITEELLLYKDPDVTIEEALSQLLTLKTSLENAVSTLLTLVKENWRKLQNISGKVHDIQKTFMGVLVAVNKFLVYARSATANASIANAKDGTKAPMQVHLSLKKLLVPLEEDLKMLTGAFNELEGSQWDLNKLAVDRNIEDGTILDAVDSFVMTSRAVSDDAQQLAIFVHNNAQYIYKQSPDSLSVQSVPTKSLSSESIARPFQEIQALQARPLPNPPQTIITSAQINKNSTNKDSDGWLDDYDYVALPEKENKEEDKKTSVTEKRISGLNKRKTYLLTLDKNTQSVVDKYKLSPLEKEQLKKLQIDLPDLLKSLSLAIDKFVKAISGGESPPSFVALGKHVIFCAHKLVFVGDCVHQHLILETAKHSVKEGCAAMCAVLKRTVASTKTAALQWPSATAVQDMIDKMCEIATCAHQIQTTLVSLLSNN